MSYFNHTILRKEISLHPDIKDKYLWRHEIFLSKNRLGTYSWLTKDHKRSFLVIPMITWLFQRRAHIFGQKTLGTIIWYQCDFIPS